MVGIYYEQYLGVYYCGLYTLLLRKNPFTYTAHLLPCQIMGRDIMRYIYLCYLQIQNPTYLSLTSSCTIFSFPSSYLIFTFIFIHLVIISYHCLSLLYHALLNTQHLHRQVLQLQFLIQSHQYYHLVMVLKQLQDLLSHWVQLRHVTHCYFLCILLYYIYIQSG